MLAEVGNGVVDTSVASFGISQERNEIVDFSPVLFKGIVTLILRQPSYSDLTIYPHILEFLNPSWIGIGVAYVIVWLTVLFAITVLKQNNFMQGEHSKWLIVIQDSLTLCLKAYISKVILSNTINCSN